MVLFLQWARGKELGGLMDKLEFYCWEKEKGSQVESKSKDPVQAIFTSHESLSACHGMVQAMPFLSWSRVMLFKLTAFTKPWVEAV